MSILQVTNGDIAASLIRELDPGSEVLPWRDVLHEGPVPAGLSLEALSDVRSLFIGAAGWDEYPVVRASFALRDAALREHGNYDELGLWFEWDLYDQLQLIQILDLLVAEGRPLDEITLVNCAGYLGELSVPELQLLAENFSLLTESAANDAVRAWSAFRQPEPTMLYELTTERELGGESLPFLRDAMIRVLEELPSSKNGLSRCEENILAALEQHALPVDELFVAAHQRVEERRFLGDTVFLMQLGRLLESEDRLVVARDNGVVELTALGRSVLCGDADWLEIGAPPRWVGGVEIRGLRSPRWDRTAGRIVRS